MKKYFKAYGKGMIWGVKHPFKEVYTTNRYDDMGFVEMMCDSLGVATVQTTIAYAIFIGGMIALGYAAKKVEGKTPRVKMVIEEPKKK